MKIQIKNITNLVKDIKHYLFFILVFSIISGFGQSQFLPKDEAIENVMEYLSQNEGQDIDFDEFSSNLSLLYDNPINLNTCTDED